MKTTLLVTGILALIGGIYFVYDRRFIFQFLYEDGFMKTSLTPLGVPIILFSLAVFLFGLYRKVAKTVY